LAVTRRPGKARRGHKIAAKLTLMQNGNIPILRSGPLPVDIVPISNHDSGRERNRPGPGGGAQSRYRRAERACRA